MGLLGHFIIGIAIGIDRPVQLLKSHQRGNKLIICMKEGSKPLFGVHIMDL